MCMSIFRGYMNDCPRPMPASPDLDPTRAGPTHEQMQRFLIGRLANPTGIYVA